MITGGVAWTAALNANKKTPLYVLSIPGIPLALSSFDPADPDTAITGGDDLFPIMQIPAGASQKIDELSGHSDISTLTVSAIDNGGQLKELAASVNAIGEVAQFLMGFPGLDLADFVPIHTGRINTPGIARDESGLMVITVGDLLQNLVSDVFLNGGPDVFVPGQAKNAFPSTFPALLDNGLPISDDNPRYLRGNPMDILLMVCQNELGIGQSTAPLLAPNIGSGSGTGVAGYAINPSWMFYDGESDLIDPNDYIEVDDLLALRNGQFNGLTMEFVVSSTETGKSWIEDEILKPLGLYWITKANGKLTLKSMKHPIPVAAVIPVAWVNRSLENGLISAVSVLAEGPSRIYIGLNTSNAPGAVNLLRTLLKSDHSTYETHSTIGFPGAELYFQAILPIDEDAVYAGCTDHGGGGFFLRFQHTTGVFTNLSYPYGSIDGISALHQMSNDPDLLIVGNMAAHGGGAQARLYSYRISTASYTQIGGYSAGGWTTVDNDVQISSISENPSGGLTIALSFNGAAGAELWDCDNTFSNWTRIAGNGEGSSWTAGTFFLLRAQWKGGQLYAGLLGSASGDAQMWRMTGATWAQMGGSGINGSWSGFTWCSFTMRLNALVVALSGSSSGDSDIWLYDFRTRSWSQIGGDGIGGSWSDKNLGGAVLIDSDHLLWAGHSNGTGGTAQLWSTTGPFGKRAAPAVDPDTHTITNVEIVGIPPCDRWPVINMIKASLPSRSASAEASGTSDPYPLPFVQQASIDNYKTMVEHTLDSAGLRLALGGYGRLFLTSNRIFARHAFATPEYTVQTFLKNFVLELGDFFLLTHPLLLDLKTGRLGVVNVLVEITDREPDYANGTVTFKAIDTRFIQTSSGAFIIADVNDATPTWIDAARVDRQSKVFISNDDGVMSDRRAGNQIS